MDKKILIGVTLLVLSGLVYAGADLLVTGNLEVNGDSLTHGDVLGENNLSINGGGQFGSSVSASNFLGETVIDNALNGATCSDACGQWKTTAYQCVEAFQGSASVLCNTPSSSGRIRCLCKS